MDWTLLTMAVLLAVGAGGLLYLKRSKRKK